jgi:hypothetical protein
MTAALCIHMPPGLRKAVEQYADSESVSLAEAGRKLIEAGIKTRGIEC